MHLQIFYNWTFFFLRKRIYFWYSMSVKKLIFRPQSATCFATIPEPCSFEIAFHIDILFHFYWKISILWFLHFSTPCRVSNFILVSDYHPSLSSGSFDFFRWCKTNENFLDIFLKESNEKPLYPLLPSRVKMVIVFFQFS